MLYRTDLPEAVRGQLFSPWGKCLRLSEALDLQLLSQHQIRLHSILRATAVHLLLPRHTLLH